MKNRRLGRGSLRIAALGAVLLLAAFDGDGRAADPAPGNNPLLSITGKVRHPEQFDLDRLRTLPNQQVQVSYQTEHGVQQARFTGVLLWALLGEAGGIADPEKGAALRHVIKVTGKDGYLVVLSTAEIAPDFGAAAAMIAFQRDGQPAGASGLRLVMPGDKHGGRDVRNVVAIVVE